MSSSSQRFTLRLIISLADTLYKVADRIAMKAERGVHPKHRLMNYHRFFMDRLNAEDVVVDFGCGYGSVSYDMAAKCRHVFGIEINEQSIQFGEKHYTRDNLSFVVGDATRWQFPDETTVVVMSNVLEHLKNRPALLRSVRTQCDRVLIRVPAFDRDWWVPFKKELGMDWRSDRTHEIEYTAESLTKEIEEAGMKIIYMERKWGEFYLECC